MVKIEVTTDTPQEMAEFLKEMGIDKIVGAHKCKCHHAEEPLKIPDPGSSEEAESHEIPKPVAEPEHKEDTPEPKRRVIYRGGNPKVNEEFDRLCKEKGLTLKPEGKCTTKKICGQCGNPFYGHSAARICPTCKSLGTRKSEETPAASATEPEPVQTKSPAVVAPPPKTFTRCIKCTTPFKTPQTDPICPGCRKQLDHIDEIRRREREEKEAAEREERMQKELESRTAWKVCPACGASFIPEKGNFYCNRCTEKALKHKKLK